MSCTIQNLLGRSVATSLTLKAVGLYFFLVAANMSVVGWKYIDGLSSWDSGWVSGDANCQVEWKEVNGLESESHKERYVEATSSCNTWVPRLETVIVLRGFGKFVLYSKTSTSSSWLFTKSSNIKNLGSHIGCDCKKSVGACVLWSWCKCGKSNTT